MATPSPAPAAFLGHGSPTNALDDNAYTRAWRATGDALQKPRVILMVSAHWYIGATAVTAMRRPKTIHDFYGFPRELFEVDYAAPGLPELAEEVAEAAKPDAVGADLDSWGLDHGTWSVLVHAFPGADIPVVQLSINALKPADYHFELGARLAALRHRGVVLMGSGNVVHNLRELDWKQPDAGFDWARRFNDQAIETITTRTADAPGLVQHPDFARIAPTPEHFLPMLYVAGHAAACGLAPKVIVDGYTYGSISMTSFGVDLPVVRPAAAPTESTGNRPATVDAEATNM